MTEETKDTTELTTEIVTDDGPPKPMELAKPTPAGMYDAADLDALDSGASDNKVEGEELYTRIAILQPGTPEVAKGVSGYKAGQLVNNKTRDVLTFEAKTPWTKNVTVEERTLEKCMPFVPIFKLPTEFGVWRSKDECDVDPSLSRLEWKTTDVTDPRVKDGCWAPYGNYDGDKPPVTASMNYLVAPLIWNEKTGLLLPGPLTTVLSFSRTSYKAGRMLTTKIEGQKTSGHRFWDRIYWIYTQFKEGGGNTWYEMHIRDCPHDPDLTASLGEKFYGSVIDAVRSLNGNTDLQESILNIATDVEHEDGGEADSATSELENALNDEGTASDDPGF